MSTMPPPPPLPDLAAWMETPEYMAMMAAMMAEAQARLDAIVAALRAGLEGSGSPPLPKPPELPPAALPPVPVPDPEGHRVEIAPIDPSVLGLSGPPVLMEPVDPPVPPAWPPPEGLPPPLPVRLSPLPKGEATVPELSPAAIVNDLVPLAPVIGLWQAPEVEPPVVRSIAMAATPEPPPVVPQPFADRQGDGGEGFRCSRRRRRHGRVVPPGGCPPEPAPVCVPPFPQPTAARIPLWLAS